MELAIRSLAPMRKSHDLLLLSSIICINMDVLRDLAKSESNSVSASASSLPSLLEEKSIPARPVS